MRHTTLVALVALLSACRRDDLDQVAPTILSVDPGIVVNEQLTTHVVVGTTGLQAVRSVERKTEGQLFTPDLWLENAGDLRLDTYGGAVYEIDSSEKAGLVTFGDGGFEFDLSPEWALGEGLWDVWGQSLDGRKANLSRALAVVPPPVITSTSAGLVCNELSDVELTVYGRGFIDLDNSLPEVSIGDAPLQVVDMDDCFEIQGGAHARSCGTLRGIVSGGDLAEGVGAVVLTNPIPVAASSVQDVQLQVVASPRLDAITPDLVSTQDSAVSFALSGEGFLVIDGELPSVQIGDWSREVNEVDGCSDLPDGGRVCSELFFDGNVRLFDVLQQARAIGDDSVQVRVVNPEPAECATSSAATLYLAPELSLVGVAPDPFCNADATTTVTLSGSGFLALDDGTLPSVDLSGWTVVADSVDGCEALPSLVGASSCTTLTFSVPPGEAGNGVLDVSVINPAPGYAVSTDEVQVEILVGPTLDGVVEGLVCDAQGDVELTLSGSGFLVLEDGTLPAVDVGGYATTAARARTCHDLSGPAGGQVCRELSVTLPSGTLSPGVVDVVVTNPEATACATSTASFEITPAPVVIALDSDLVCNEDADDSFTLSGSGFVVTAEGDLPTIAVGDLELSPDRAEGCVALSGPAGGEVCSALAFTLPAGSTTPGVHEVGVTNPETGACSDSGVQLETVGEPVVSAVSDELFCDEEGDTELWLTGSGFVVLADGSRPTVTLGGNDFSPSAVDGCTELLGPSGGSSCSGLSVVVPASALADAVHAVSVTNPGLADCESSGSVEIQTIGLPVLDALDADLVCNADDNRLDLSGSGFLKASDGELPTVSVGDWSGTATAALGCVPLGGPEGGQLCDELWVDLPGGVLLADVQAVGVTNPGTAECSSVDEVQLETVDEPAVTAVVEDLFCDADEDTVLVVTGESFLVLADGTLPTAELGGEAVFVDSAEGCTALSGPAGGEICDTLNLTVEAGSMASGEHELVVTNPGDAGCQSVAGATLEVVDGPILRRVDIETACLDGDAVTLTLTGTDFVVGADGTLPTVTVGSWSSPADSADDCTDLSGPAGGETCNELSITLPSGDLSAGVVEISVDNPSAVACSTDSVQFEIIDAPTVDAVDSELVCNDSEDTTLTLSGTGFYVDSGRTRPNVLVGGASYRARTTSDCTALSGPGGGWQCNELTVQVPAGTLGLAVVDVVVVNPDAGACESSEIVQVEATTTPTLASVSETLFSDAQAETVLVLGGSDFVQLADGTLPSVAIGAHAYTPDAIDGCTALAGPAGGYSCSELTLTVGTGDLGRGVYDLSVTNPETDGCTSSDDVSTEVVPAPTLSLVSDGLLCNAESDSTVTLTGRSFIVLADGTLPTVTWGSYSARATSADRCSDLEGPAGGESCRELSFTAPAGALDVGVSALSVTNPETNGGTSTATVESEVVDGPSLSTLDTQLFCAAEDATTLQLSGNGFLTTAAGDLPTVSLGGWSGDADMLDGCTALTGPEGGQLCDTVIVTVPASAVSEGVSSVQVDNPSPASCSTHEDVQLQIVDAPSLDGVDEELFCDAEEDTTLTLTGTGFIELSDGSLPTVELGGYSAAADAAGGCTALTGPEGGQSCTSLSFTLPAASLGAGTYGAQVTNPGTASCVTTEDVDVQIVGQPTVRAVDEALVCDENGDQDLVVAGTGFVKLADGTLPSVDVGGTTVSVDGASSCAVLSGPAGGWTCNQLSITLTGGTLVDGPQDVVVVNPETGTCEGTGSSVLEATSEPVLSGIDTDLVCLADGGTTATLTGSGFIRLAGGTLPTVTIGTWSGRAASADGCTALTGPDGGSSCTELSVSLPLEAVDADVHEVDVVNPELGRCGSDSIEVEVVDAAVIASVDTALGCNEDGDVTVDLFGSFLRLADGTLPTVTVGSYSAVADAASGCTALSGPSGADSCTGLSMTLPAGTLSGGIYDVVVTNPGDADCPSTAASLEILDAPVVSSVDSGWFCDAQGDVTLTLTGRHFLQTEAGDLPTVDVGGYVSTADDLRHCDGLEGPEGGLSCTTLILTIPAGTLGAGLVDIAVTNPAPAACTSDDAVAIEGVSRPSLSGTDYDLVCDDDDDSTVVLSGSGFLVLDDGSLPEVAIGDWSGQADSASGCTSLTGPEGGQVCSLLSVTLPSDSVDDGLAAVVVTNPSPAQCFSTETVQLEVVPAPAVDLVDLDPFCDDQGDVTLMLSGSDFIELSDGTLPIVDFGTWTTEADSAGGCAALAGAGGGWSCSWLEVTVPAGTLTGGLYDVVVTNPSGASGDCSATALPVQVVGEPVLSAIAGDLVCNEQGETEFTLSGEGFLVLADGTTPEVDFGGTVVQADSADDCTELSGPSGGWVCTELVATVPQGVLATGIDSAIVTNPAPAECISGSVDYEDVARPVTTAVTEDLFCTQQGSTFFVIDGSGFVQLADGTLPTVSFGDWPVEAYAASGCTALSGPAGGWTCTQIEVELSSEAVDDAVHNVVVTNPGYANCSDTDGIEAQGVPQPYADTIEPAATCDSGTDKSFSVSGSGFIVLADGTFPTVDFGGSLLTPDDVTGCTALAGPAGGWTCTTVTFSVASSAISSGTVYSVDITNPVPADCFTEGTTVQVEIVPRPTLSSVSPSNTCVEEAGTVLTLTGTGFIHLWSGGMPLVGFDGTYIEANSVSGCSDLASGVGETCTTIDVAVEAGVLASGPLDVTVMNPGDAECETTPAVTAYLLDGPTVASTSPEGVCNGGDSVVTVSGTNFYTLGGAKPEVEIDGTIFPVTSLAGCSAVPAPGSGQVCTSANFTYNDGDLASGDYGLTLTNPAPYDCASDGSYTFSVAVGPTISSIAPDQICATGTVDIYGSGFTSDVEVIIGGMAATVISVTSSVVSVDVPSGLAEGFHDVTVDIPGLCGVTLTGALEVVGFPSLFYADPPVVYSGVSYEATWYITGVAGTVADTWVTPVACDDGLGDACGLCGGAGACETHLSYSFDPSVSHIVRPTLPAGGLPDGVYNAFIDDSVGCDAELVDAFEVKSDLTVDIERLDPPFGWDNDYTAVSIYATDPAGAGMTQFQDVPRVYLVESSGTARQVNSIGFVDATLLTAVVRPEYDGGPPVGDYDIMVVNPDGGIGYLPYAFATGFAVTADPVPEITFATPAAVKSNEDKALTIIGANFRGTTATVSVDLACASGSTYSLPVTGVSSTQIDATFNAASQSMTRGVCLLRVTNSDGLYSEYASLTISSPSGNLVGFRVDTPMGTPRRGLAAAVGAATGTARFLYAIGGDSGSAASAMNTIEVVSVNPYGALVGSWTELPDTLPSDLTIMGSTILDDRFIYLLGGNDGTGAVDQVIRAQILDPEAAPKFSSLSMSLGTGAELTGGTWIYRIAALYPSTYETNPSGESMASDPIVVNVPSGVPETITVRLDWTQDTAASGYRVYRTPAAGSGSGTEEWLADVSGSSTTEYVDTGTTTTPGLEPHVRGSLGEWFVMDPLPVPLEGAAVGVAEDPATPDLWYIYVAGGRDDTGTIRDEIYYMDVDVVGSDRQDVAISCPGWCTATPTLTGGRWQLSAIAIDPTLFSVAEVGDVTGGPESWIIFGAGFNGPASVSSETEAGLVDVGGDFVAGEWYNTVKEMNALGGYSAFGLADFVMQIGGSNGGAPLNSGSSAELCSTGGGGCAAGIPDPPDTKNWNSLGAGGTLFTPRYLPGTAQSSGVLFMVGGDDGTGACTDVEWNTY